MEIDEEEKTSIWSLCLDGGRFDSFGERLGTEMKRVALGNMQHSRNKYFIKLWGPHTLLFGKRYIFYTATDIGSNTARNKGIGSVWKPKAFTSWVASGSRTLEET